MSLITTAVFFTSCFCFSAKRLIRYLRYFQQEEYAASRFLSWLLFKGAYDTRGSFVLLATLVGSLFFKRGDPIFSLIGASFLLLIAYLEENPLQEGKLKLHLTNRAKRILAGALVICLSLHLLVFLFSVDISWPLTLILQLFVFQTTPLCLVAGCWLWSGYEKSLQKRFIEEAKEKINASRPFIVGITGSYGKSSTKDLLARVLQNCLGPTFWPPKGVNALMGNTRAIREDLQSLHQYVVIEMGAYKVGSIAKACRLTPPNAAIITGIGQAHLERFGSQENIEKAKSELADALCDGAILVCNGDSEGTRNIYQKHKTRVKSYLYGFDLLRMGVDCQVTSFKITPEGTYFSLRWLSKDYDGFTPQFGRACLSNIAAAFTLSCALGADPKLALATLGSIPAIDNRLNLSKEGPVTYLRDAYNSNPEGFKVALEVLRDLPFKRRLLMSPGMIEFGARQAEFNSDIACFAAKICDKVIIVGQINKKAILEGLERGGYSSENIFLCPTRKAAFIKLSELLESGDGVLIENDLPDLYEFTSAF